MPKITRISTRDVRFRNGPGEGTDSVHSTGEYAYAVCCIHTDNDDLNGTGLAFTLGGGNETVTRAIEALAAPLVGQDLEALMADFGRHWHRMSNHPTWRWLGPEKGTVHLAVAAITNGCFDLWAKSRGMPLWQLLLSLTPEQVVALCDFSFVDDALSPTEALDMLTAERARRAERESVLETGYPGYDTSFGWIQFSDAQLEANAKQAMLQGFRAVKLKVGSPNTERDIRRAFLVRKVLGPDVRIMLDVNQQWSIAHAQESWAKLKPMNPFWLEEPTHPDDVSGHKVLQDSGIPVAVGEAIPNRVLFKNFMQAGACTYIQVDPVRTGGVSECIVVALLARKYNLTVVPHVGDMGQISQHLVLFYHVGLGLPKLFLEYIPHLAKCFKEPAQVRDGVYETPRLPGASSDIHEFVRNYSEAGLYDTERRAHIGAEAAH